jgi:hypothetical protein
MAVVVAVPEEHTIGGLDVDRLLPEVLLCPGAEELLHNGGVIGEARVFSVEFLVVGSQVAAVHVGNVGDVILFEVGHSCLPVRLGQGASVLAGGS